MCGIDCPELSKDSPDTLKWGSPMSTPSQLEQDWPDSVVGNGLARMYRNRPGILLYVFRVQRLFRLKS